MSAAPESEFAKGVKEGRTDALLVEHSKHLGAINGSVAKTAAALTALKQEVHDGIAELASAIRTLEEQGRLAEERVETTRRTLATETERRKDALEVTADELTLRERGADRKWSKWQQVAALAVAVSAVIVTILAASGHLP